MSPDRNMTIYFNSQPHEEADVDVIAVSGSRYISTHSLTKRLTKMQTRSSDDGYHFNSQPHEEADHLDTQNATSMYISTHSLTKRLTISGIPCPIHEHFNSQPHEEADKPI